jgi:hypothetical protein
MRVRLLGPEDILRFDDIFEIACRSATRGYSSRPTQRSTAASCETPGRHQARRAGRCPLVLRFPYSHSMVDGGLDEMSSATRFTAGISLMIRLEIVSKRS